MPRKVTVTLADGRQVTYANVPYSVTPQAMAARVQGDYNQHATSIDGGGAPAAGTPDFYEHRWANIPQAQAKALVQRYSAAGVKSSDPRMAGLMRVAGVNSAPPPVQRKNVVTAAADAAKGEAGGDYLSAIKGGLTRGLPGFEQATAALASVLPSSISGIEGNPGYSNILQALRARTNAEMERAPITGAVSNLAGNIVGLGTAGGAVKAGAAKLAASSTPAAAATGNVLSKIATMAKPTVGKGLSIGEKAANAARIVATGAAGGGVTAASEGGDVTRGAAGGAVGAGVVGGVGKLLSVAAQPVKAILGVSTAPQILAKFTSVTADVMRAVADKYKTITSTEPTLFELLPPADRNALIKGVVAGKDAVVDQATKAIAARAKKLGPDMAAKVANVVDPQRAAIKDKIAGDLAKARGTDVGNLAPEDHALIDKAMTNPTDMDALRKKEWDAYLDPHASTPVVDNLHDLYPQIPGENGGPPIAVDPEINSAIRNSSNTMESRSQDAGISAGDVSNIMVNLRRRLGGPDPDKAAVAQRALDHLHDVLDNVAPEAGAASRNATDAWSARSRMMEGMDAGMSGNLRDMVQTGTSGTRARLVRNAFDSVEGQDGLVLGHSNALMSDLGGSPTDALRATVGIARGRTSRELTQSLGQDAADQIGAAAQAQDESAQALASAASQAQGAGSGGDTASTMVNAIIGLHPGGFLTTKAHALTKLAHMTVVPENQAKAITEMLFSQDPSLRGKAIQALSNVPGGQDFLQSISGVAGGAAGGTITAPAIDSPEPAPSAPNPDDLPLPPADHAMGGESTPSATATPEAGAPVDDTAAAPVDPQQSPYADHLQNLYATENPAALNFYDKIAHQETRGQHFDANGKTKISKAGAIGLMQVMPGTAPEAAHEAGLPLDMAALHSDPAYNYLVGAGHLGKLLAHYNGDPAKAAAAYNAGTGNVDKALAGGGNWLARLPAETQDYVAKVVG